MQFTSTQSIFTMTAGPVDLTATFLSPVEVWFLMIILGYFMFSCIST